MPLLIYLLKNEYAYWQLEYAALYLHEDLLHADTNMQPHVERFVPLYADSYQNVCS